jgi:hypothetical protein
LELVEQMNSLLRMKVVVEPVRKHEEIRDHKGRVERRARRELPVNEWDIHIFEGGRIQVPPGVDGEAMAREINHALAEAIRPFVAAQVSLALASLGGGEQKLEDGKRVQGCLVAIDGLRNIEVMCSGGVIVPRRAAFRAIDLARATAFERAINDVFTSRTAPQVVALRVIIVERLKAL